MAVMMNNIHAALMKLRRITQNSPQQAAQNKMKRPEIIVRAEEILHWEYDQFHDRPGAAGGRHHFIIFIGGLPHHHDRPGDAGGSAVPED